MGGFHWHAEQHCTALVQYNSPIPAVSTAFSATPTIPSKANPDDGESHKAPGRLSPFVADMPREPGKTRQVPRKNQGSEDRRGV
ncbi:hypothetical protein V499_09235 [Pseudogymnoascus sp. VKM F-103]|nr:hypothetical protein V499_09235 [Pseudogymnoascus sp. VKM F-103]